MKDKSEKQMECGKSCKEIDVPTEDELNALNALRTIKNRVRELKKRISDLSLDDKGENKEELLALEGELAALKEEWNAWEEKRKEAARERMILLGHESPH
ncbi:MAG: hypothetical protein PVI20_08390 [Desulfobacteraceae bacterium]|jgi:hypothetical protein